jgi:hypothetical protein
MAQELIADLEAATNETMQLISAHQLSEPQWEQVTQRQHDACERWMDYLNSRN